MKAFQDDHVKNLPDVYRKDKGSNNSKILQIEKDAVNDFRKSLNEIDHILNIENATGKTLDMYGERIGQKRGSATDEQYLALIKTKITQNLANGTHKSVVEGIAFALKCDPSEIALTDGEAPCSIEVKSLPLETITKAGFTAEQVVALINRMIPCGGKLSSFMFEGTFEFCESESAMVVDEEAGFCDVEGGNIGGYFGVTTGDSSVSDLPI